MKLPALALVFTIFLCAASDAADPLALGPEQLVALTDGKVITVSGYSVPSLADWNSDGLQDLIVGEGGGIGAGKVRVYLNVGSVWYPRFSSFFYAQSNGADLVVPASGCLGAFPRVVQWDGDARKDLVVGRADGKVELFLNVNTDTDPAFGTGAFLQVGQPGVKVDISVGVRATPDIVDWDGDGDKDLIVGAYDGRLYLFVNQGTNFAPDFHAQSFVTNAGGDVTIPFGRSSPVVRDVNNDQVLDLLSGNTYGELYYYEGPAYAVPVKVQSESTIIDIPGSARSRPSVCNWTSDGALDVLIGAGDGVLRLYQGASTEIVLDVTPTSVKPTDTIEFTTGRGYPNDLVALFVVDVNGGPCLTMVTLATFGADYEWKLALPMPPGYSGIIPTFRSYAINMGGYVGGSNDVVVTFK